MKALRLKMGTLLAADAATLAPATDANLVGLFANNLTPSEDLIIGDVTPATFGGYAALAAGTGAQGVAIDPLTGDQIITIKEPAGGWRWVTSNATNLPQTVYGFYLTNDAEDTLFAVGLLTTPITLQEAGQQINLGSVTFTVVAQPLT